MAPQVRKASRDRLVLLELLVLPAPRDRRVILVRKVLLASKARRAIPAIRVHREFRAWLARLGQKAQLVSHVRKALRVILVHIHRYLDQRVRRVQSVSPAPRVLKVQSGQKVRRVTQEIPARLVLLAKVQDRTHQRMAMVAQTPSRR